MEKRKRTSNVIFLIFLLPFTFYLLPAFAAEETSPAESEPIEEPAAEESPALDSANTGEGALTPLEEAGGDVPADQQVRPSSLGLDERVSLDLRNIEVADALRFLALKGGLNMAVSKNVSGRVQLLLNNVPIRDILDIILITNALAFEKIGDVYYIMSDAEYKERYGRKFSDARRVKIFKLRYAIPEQAFALFEVLKSEVGRLLVDPESGTVLVMDSPENIAKMEDALNAMEQKRSVKVFGLKYAKALDIETRLKTRLDNKKVGSVSADERTNAVIVETLPARMREVEEIISALDEKTREVLIEAKIVKVTITDDRFRNISWEGMFRQFSEQGERFISNHPINALARTGQSFVDDFFFIEPTARPPVGGKNEVAENLVLGQFKGDEGFELLINFLNQIGKTKILSNPKLAVINNQEAKIHVGEKQAYVTTTTTAGQTTTTTAESVTFIDVGIQLSVTPNINPDGFVTMKIKPEISSVADFLITPSGNRIPIVDSSLAETTVMVKDGVSILIGGLKKEEHAHSNKKVPLLGDLPLLGGAFQSKSTNTAHTETLILITPHIIYGDRLVTGERPAMVTPYMTYEDYPVAKAGEGVPTPVVKS